MRRQSRSPLARQNRRSRVDANRCSCCDGQDGPRRPEEQYRQRARLVLIHRRQTKAAT
jgi:hypothetical protein